MSVNGHVVLRDLDIFSKVGRGVAHDELIPFTIKGGKLKIADEISDYDGLFSVKFVKVEHADDILGTRKSCFNFRFFLRGIMTTQKSTQCTSCEERSKVMTEAGGMEFLFSLTKFQMFPRCQRRKCRKRRSRKGKSRRKWPKNQLARNPNSSLGRNSRAPSSARTKVQFCCPYLSQPPVLSQWSSASASYADNQRYG